MHKSSLKWIILSLAVIGLDQVTKYLISTNFQLYEVVPVIPGVNLALVHNVGAAFSFLSEAGGWQRWFFVMLSAIVSTGIVIWLSRTPANLKWLACSLSLILGGAVGNLIDRVQYGYVVDFIDVYFRHWHWYTFNIADSAISIGAVMLVIDTIWLDRAHVSTHTGKSEKG